MPQGIPNRRGSTRHLVHPPDLDLWQAQAACRTVDPAHYDQGDETAAATCQGCPVRRPCLVWALDHHESGYWAGLTDERRGRLRARDWQPTNRMPPPKPVERPDPVPPPDPPRRAATIGDPGSWIVPTANRQWAEQAMARARQVGALQVAKEAHVSYMTLCRAWDKHGLGRPGRARKGAAA